MDRGIILQKSANWFARQIYGALEEWVEKAVPRYLRPPGAVEETVFLATCRRCGKCAEACTFGAISLVGGEAGVGVGTPALAPRRAPCRLCLACVEVCPSGALKRVTVPRIGAARISQSRCIAWQGGFCQRCLDECPPAQEAIALQDFEKPAVDEERCSGCGACEHICPVEPAAIRVAPARKEGEE